MGKPLPSNIYALITYIESNILEESSKKKINPQAEKAKVLRETKFIPKIVLCIENFNKHVIMLAKKTNDRLANLLHYGTVRDFRIKTSDLKAAIDRTLSHSSQIDAEENNEEDITQDTEEGENEEETLLRQIEEESREIQSTSKVYDKESDEGNGNATEDESCSTSRSSTPAPTTSKLAKKKTQEKAKKEKDKEKEKEKEKDKDKEKEKDKEKASTKRKLANVKEDELDAKTPNEKAKKKKLTKEPAKKKSSSKAAATTIEIISDNENDISHEADTLDNESNRESCTQLLDNLAKINAKSKKRTLRDSEQQEDPDVLCAPPLEPEAKKRKRTRQTKGK